MGRRVAWDWFYSTTAWKRLRKQQLLAHPLCAICLESQGLPVPATVVDHVQPHGGDWTLFRLGKLQSLCKPCHDSAKRVLELHGYSTQIGLDGFPVDRQHPFWK